MGGWYQKAKLLELLSRAEELLFQEGHHSESDAVEQAIVIIDPLPRGSMMKICEHEFIREPDAPRGYACANCYCTPPDDWCPQSPDVE